MKTKERIQSLDPHAGRMGDTLRCFKRSPRRLRTLAISYVNQQTAEAALREWLFEQKNEYRQRR